MRLTVLGLLTLCLAAPVRAEEPVGSVKFLRSLAKDEAVHVLCKEKQQCGLMAASGELVLAQDYRSLTVSPSIPGEARQVIAERSQGGTGVFDLTGQWLVKPKYENASYLRNKRAAIKSGGAWGYVDANDQIIVAPGYEIAMDFTALATAVYRNGKWGLIDTNGLIVAEAKYSVLKEFIDGVAIFASDQGYGLIDVNGKEIHTGYTNIEPFSEGLAMALKELNRVGFVDKTGKWVFRTKFQTAGNFHEGLASVTNGDRTGFVAKDGRVTIPLKFDDAQDFSGGVAPVAVNRKWGVIDRKGRWAIKPRFDYLWSFKKGVAIANRGASFDEFGMPENDDGTWGAISASGEWIVKPQFDVVEVMEDLIVAWKANRKAISTLTASSSRRSEFTRRLSAHNQRRSRSSAGPRDGAPSPVRVPPR